MFESAHESPPYSGSSSAQMGVYHTQLLQLISVLFTLGTVRYVGCTDLLKVLHVCSAPEQTVVVVVIVAIVVVVVIVVGVVAATAAAASVSVAVVAVAKTTAILAEIHSAGTPETNHVVFTRLCSVLHYTRILALALSL